MRLLLVQIFEHGFFHGDPHPGNVFLLPDGRICYHDFGIIGELSSRDQESVRQLFLAVIARDADWFVEAYLSLGGALGTIDRPAFARDVAAALDRYYASHGQESSFGEILHQFMQLGGKHNIHLSREMLLVAKAFMLTETVVRTLNPGFDNIAAFQQYSLALMQRALAPDFSQSGLARAYRALAVLRWGAAQAPHAIGTALQDLHDGKLALRVKHDDLDSLQKHLERAANRLSFSFIIGAIVIASSIVTTYHAGPHYRDIPLIGLAGYARSACAGSSRFCARAAYEWVLNSGHRTSLPKPADVARTGRYGHLTPPQSPWITPLYV